MYYFSNKIKLFYDSAYSEIADKNVEVINKMINSLLKI